MRSFQYRMYFEWDLLNIGELLRPADLRIFEALRLRDANAVKAAIGNGGDINAAGAWGYTPLIVMASIGDVEMGKLCLECGASINKPMSRGITPVYVSVRRLNRQFTTMLADRGANPNIWETPLENPAICLAARCDTVTLEILASGRVPLNLDAQYDDDMTLAMLAIHSKIWNVAEFATARQGNQFLRDRAGLTLMDYIKAIGDERIRARLKRVHGAPDLSGATLTAIEGRRKTDKIQFNELVEGLGETEQDYLGAAG